MAEDRAGGPPAQVLTFLFLFVILGATDSRAPAGFAPIPIGFALCLIHLIGIPSRGSAGGCGRDAVAA